MLDDLIWYKLKTTLKNIRKKSSSHSHIFTVIEAIRKEVTNEVFEDKSKLYFNKIIFHITDKNYRFKVYEGTVFDVEFLFFGIPQHLVVLWKEKFEDILNRSGNFNVFKIEDPSIRKLGNIEFEQKPLPIEGEICLEFLSPCSFESKKNKFSGFISESDFLTLLEKRINFLFNQKIKIDVPLESFRVLPYYWKFVSLAHPSKSCGGTHHIKGYSGYFYIKGDLSKIGKYLFLCSELHIGNKLSNSQGYYKIHSNSKSSFVSIFKNIGFISSIVAEARDRYEIINESEIFVDESNEKIAKKIIESVFDRDYRPQSNMAFEISKKNGETRIIEQLNPFDTLLSFCLLKVLQPVFDNFFEDESIGFRKGKNPEIAAEYVESAIKEACKFVVESDVEDFFGNIKHDQLKNLFDEYLPREDNIISEVLLKLVKTGFIFKGKEYERELGLSQGSPLSPLLANLYLDAFDEKMKAEGAYLIRYADDFVLLTKTEETAIDLLNVCRQYLNTLGLNLKANKTSVKSISDGFQFLGIQFNLEGSHKTCQNEFRLLKKTLYITEPYCFLKLNGDSLSVTKNKEVKSTFPLRRIDEIILIENVNFNTSLIRKCSELKIPITINHKNNSYVQTIRPDSKSFYEIINMHSTCYNNLSDAEKLIVAKHFAVGKIENFVSMFKQRYKVGDFKVFSLMESYCKRIYNAFEIEEVRGLEGRCTVEIFKQMNREILFDEFRLKKRERFGKDPMNTLLNFAFYLLYGRINAHIRTCGLNPYLGFLHCENNRYESLAADVEELFRASVIKIVIKIVNLKIIQASDFEDGEKRLLLKRDAVKKFIHHYESEMIKKDKKGRVLEDEINKQVEAIRQWVVNGSMFYFYKWE